MVNKKDLDDLKADLKSFFQEGLKEQTATIAAKCDDILKECRDVHNQHNERLAALEFEQENTTETIKSLQSKLEQSDKKIIQMEAKLLEGNLRFSNITPMGTAEESVRHFLQHILNLPADTVNSIQFLKCYKIGRPASNDSIDTRTIVVNFQKQTDIQLIKNAAYKKPKGTRGGVREDLPYTWATKRSDLFKKFILPARQDKDFPKPVKVKWTGADLELNGVNVNPEKSYEAFKKQIKNN